MLPLTLEEILINERLTTQDQIDEALDYQRDQGGQLADHLYRLGYVTEVDLVGAMSRQTQVTTVNLAAIEIDEQLLALLPLDLVFSELVLPINLDRTGGKVTVACENQLAPGLKEKLEEQLPEYDVEIVLALGAALRSCIVRHYRQPITEATASPEPTPLIEKTTPPEPPVEKLTAKPHPTLPRLIPEGGTPDSAETACRILIFDEQGHGHPALGQTLIRQGFKIRFVASREAMGEIVTKLKPNAILILNSISDPDLDHFFGELEKQAVSLTDTPIYLIAENFDPDQVSTLMKRGVEDVIPRENLLDLLMIKLRRLRDRLAAETEKRRQILQDLGTHGSLADMNVIDLLQTLGLTGKSAHVSISGSGRQLTLYLNNGKLVFAECEGFTGAEAVYQGISMTTGIWSIDPIAPEDLPPANNDLPTEFILLEGCRRLDEQNRVEHTTPIKL